MITSEYNSITFFSLVFYYFYYRTTIRTMQLDLTDTILCWTYVTFLSDLTEIANKKPSLNQLQHEMWQGLFLNCEYIYVVRICCVMLVLSPALFLHLHFTIIAVFACWESTQQHIWKWENEEGNETFDKHIKWLVISCNEHKLNFRISLQWKIHPFNYKGKNNNSGSSNGHDTLCNST
jgi:hypothetical protein